MRAALVGVTLTVVLLYARHFGHWPFRPTRKAAAVTSCSSSDFNDSASRASFSQNPLPHGFHREPSSGLTKAGELPSLRAAATGTASSRSRAGGGGVGFYLGGFGPGSSPLAYPARSDTTRRGAGSTLPPSSRNAGELSEASSTPGVQVSCLLPHYASQGDVLWVTQGYLA
jgi:hypothetical protein